MTAFPNSSAMDATAAGGGPITMLPLIVTGQPAQILQHVTEVLGKATQFVSLLEDLDKARKQLGEIWSGHASESALTKIAESLQQFEKIIKAIQDGAKLLQEAAQLVQTVQTAYRSIVSAVNPTVAALMSNPWTHAAARALSTATSGTLRSFIQAIGQLLNALGVTKLGTVLTDLGTVIGALQQLFGGGSAATGGAVSGSGVSASPVTAPGTVTTVASGTGQQAIAGGVGTAGLPTMTPVTGTTAATGLQGLLNVPGQVTSGVTAGLGLGATGLGTSGVPSWLTGYNPTALAGTGGADDSWIPVDGNGDAGGTDTGSAGDAGSGDAGSGDSGSSDGGSGDGGTTTTGSGDVHDTTITATKGDLSVTVEVPVEQGHATGIDLNVSSGSESIAEHVDIDANGAVSVS
ncbi:hypothetical protein Athai_11300 [Actinocatenispora thailandica]|uniref:WXG100 family type VII secretion target n=1 Tax=Actinocatenispora thailandica TaxID=227318 RepID=A0A7R7DL50_9ACTN|nr:WXG100 family type VII secretion target [Actinocatenispora thailandica]BCJ33627.1 hypothetical protein Athai_11300 [Actinocatenispora thailandica]